MSYIRHRAVSAHLHGLQWRTRIILLEVLLYYVLQICERTMPKNTTKPFQVPHSAGAAKHLYIGLSSHRPFSLLIRIRAPFGENKMEKRCDSSRTSHESRCTVTARLFSITSSSPYVEFPCYTLHYSTTLHSTVLDPEIMQKTGTPRQLS